MTDKECISKIKDIIDNYIWDEDSDGTEFMYMIVKVMLEYDKKEN